MRRDPDQSTSDRKLTASGSHIMIEQGGTDLPGAHPPRTRVEPDPFEVPPGIGDPLADSWFR